MQEFWKNKPDEDCFKPKTAQDIVNDMFRTARYLGLSPEFVSGLLKGTPMEGFIASDVPVDVPPGQVFS